MSTIRKWITLPPSIYPFLAFLGLSILAETLSIEGNPLYTLKQSAYLVALYAGIFLVSNEPDRLRPGFVIFGVAALVYFSAPLYQWLSAYSATGVSKRIDTYDLNVSRSSLLIVFGILSLWLFLLEPLVTRTRNSILRLAVFSLVILATGIVAVVFQSRSSLIAIGLFLLCYGAMRSNLRLMLLVTLLLVGIAVSTGIHDVFLERGISYRNAIWYDALQRIGRDCSWLTGCGSDGNYRFAGQFVNPHGGYVATLYHYGTPSLAALLVLMYQVFSKGMKEKNPYLLLSTVGWGGAIASSAGFIDSPQPQWVYLWIPTFLTLSSRPNAPRS